MHYGATASIFENAKFLRDNQTPTEIILWNYLNKNQLGVKFRRQHPLYTYIADFYCHKLKLVIELDGEYHNTEEQISLDDARTKDIEHFGISVIRFTNKDIINDIDSVIEKIEHTIDSLSN